MENTSDIIDCKFCGEEIKATAIKCKHCGEFLQENKNQQIPTINILNQQNNNSGDSSNEKSWIVALLLSIFLPGIDRFYLGHGGLGVVKILTFFGFGIWYIIDILLILTKSVGGIKWK